jgi:hypothetical protein
MSSRWLIRHDDRAAGGEHAADAVADRDLGAGIFTGAVPRICGRSPARIDGVRTYSGNTHLRPLGAT